ncbi:MAG: hypothetical protein H3C51_06315 [Rubellimicrobium sp.]|nr:hypothetical protein [Rubellimicrobium sp.]
MRALTLALAACALTLPAVPAAAQDMLLFRAPSGNISCMMATWDGGYARCDISDYTPSFRNSGDCQQDYGFAFEVGAAGAGQVLCAGDTVWDSTAWTLPYGQSRTLGAITCTSRTTGMVCANRQGHGFAVARAAQRVF